MDDVERVPRSHHARGVCRGCRPSTSSLGGAGRRRGGVEHRDGLRAASVVGPRTRPLKRRVGVDPGGHRGVGRRGGVIGRPPVALYAPHRPPRLRRALGGHAREPIGLERPDEAVVAVCDRLTGGAGHAHDGDARHNAVGERSVALGVGATPQLPGRGGGRGGDGDGEDREGNDPCLRPSIPYTQPPGWPGPQCARRHSARPRRSRLPNSSRVIRSGLASRWTDARFLREACPEPAPTSLAPWTKPRCAGAVGGGFSSRLAKQPSATRRWRRADLVQLDSAPVLPPSPLSREGSSRSRPYVEKL